MLIKPHIKTTTKRIEYKDTFQASRLTHMEKRLFSSKLCFRTQHPTRTVNSLYFDTLDLISYRDSIEGGSNRCKKRLRWYNHLNSDNDATLEFKMKNGHQSWKKIWVKAFRINPLQKSWNDFYKPKKEEFPSKVILRNFHPTSIVSYDRKYLVSFDNKIRVTIDQNLKFFDQRHCSNPNLAWNKPSKNIVVIEVKTELSNESLLQNFFSEIPFSPSRFSKYCESIMPQRNNLRY